jgi:hypothetical protein
MSTILEEEESRPNPGRPRKSKIWRKGRRKKAPSKPKSGPLGSLVELQEKESRAILLDERLHPLPRGESLERDPFTDVDLIISGEEGSDAPPWSFGAPTEDPEGHEWQYYDPAPGDLKEEEVQALIHKRVEESSVDPARRAALLETILNRKEAFLTKGCPIKRLVGTCHEIEVTGRPFKEQPSRVSASQREVLEKEIKSMLSVGVIQPSKSSWSSRLVMVKKPDNSWRPCVDYRCLNQQTKPNTYPLPVIDDLLAKVSEGKIFTQMDLYSGFWQIPMNPADIEKTAFTSPLGLYEWKFMPFGLMNAPATFQAVMEKVLAPVLWKTCVVYIDDLVIFSQTEEEHLEHLAEVLKLLDEAGLRMKVEKCHFGVRRMQLLGFDFREDGMRP